MKRSVFGGFITAVTTAALLAAAPTGAHATGARSQDDGPQARAERAAAALVASKPGLFRVGANDRLIARNVESSHGLQYVSYERTYRGLPVVGGDFVVVTDAQGKVLNTSVAQKREVRLAGTRPSVSQGAAENTAADLVDGAMVEGSRLAVLHREASSLVWEATVAGTREGKPSRLTVWVDAADGKVLGTQELVADGTGNGAWSGPNPLQIATSFVQGKYSLTTPGATTLKCGTTSKALTGTDDVWGNGDATSKETGCVDALYGAQQERAMLSSWLGRNGMDGAGGWVGIQVGLNDVNAYYDGRKVAIGHNTVNQWISSMDVVAHEFGHGIDHRTPGGISGGGTQEFVADTFGAATEAFDNQPAPYDVPDYTVGEEVNLVGNGPIRYMYKPSLAGDDNCWTTGTATQEVHAAAGPGNHWFYLLAEGSNPTNGQPASPTCNGSSVTGIGIQKAMTIMYNAMLQKTTGSGYGKYRVWTVTAAKNLYGSADCNTVKAAWSAVNLPAQAGEPAC